MSSEHQTLTERLRIRASIRRQISSRKSVQEGKPDRLADLLDEAATEITRLQNIVENKPASVIATGIYEHCSYQGTYPIHCEVLEKRKWNLDDAHIWEKLTAQTLEAAQSEKAHLDGYVIRYFDDLLSDTSTEWVKDLYIRNIDYNISGNKS